GYQYADLRKVAGRAGYKIEQATGRGDSHVDATAQRHLLIAVADTSIKRDDPRGAMTPQRNELGGDLRAELAGRDDHERERCRGPPVDALEDRKSEGTGLPGARLRLREEIAHGAKGRARKVLDRREARPTEVTRRAIKGWRKSDLVERVLPTGVPTPSGAPAPGARKKSGRVLRPGTSFLGS